jgi:hypothetical protein
MRKTETKSFPLKIASTINRSHSFYDALKVSVQTVDFFLKYRTLKELIIAEPCIRARWVGSGPGSKNSVLTRSKNIVLTGSGSENFVVRASSALIIIRSPLEFHGKCIEFDNHRLQVNENSILCLQTTIEVELGNFTKRIKSKIWVQISKN